MSKFIKHRSETSQCRPRLAPFCAGAGADVGFGGDPIKRDAICIDLVRPYTRTGLRPQHLSIRQGNLPILGRWFEEGALDYVFSSHLIEDFTYSQQEVILSDWLRTVRKGGRIVLYQPDQPTYAEHCRRTGQPVNLAHIEGDYSLRTFRERVARFLVAREIHAAPLVEVYSWEIVLEKL
jgi:SAM-dependent methyltransferase